MFAGKRILLGVTGGIAAYKAVELCRLLVRAGADVRVIMTEAAKEFITPLTFQTVSNNPVYSNLFAAVDHYNVQHVGLAGEADLFVIAPATANCLGKISAGIADDLLTTTVMAASCPVLLAPAMNKRMYENPVTQANLRNLSTLGYIIIPPGEGELACRDTGRGRLAEVEDIFKTARTVLNPARDWQGISVLVTAGPTREALDPVRYLTNRSSGKMGYCLAAAAAKQGAEVLLISGPTNLPRPAGVRVIDVVSAEQMFEAVMLHFRESDVIIKAAAVSDFKPSFLSKQKIKKEGELTLTLLKTRDILAEIGLQKDGRFLAGFAAETEDVGENALEKLRRKNLDMIIANDLTLDGAGFDLDTNIVRIIFTDGSERELPILPKNEVAREILFEIYNRYIRTRNV